MSATPVPAVRLVVNGRERDAAPGLTVAALVAELAPPGSPATPMVAVERNGEIVPRARWAETALADGDHLEIVRFVQGG